MMFVSQDSPRSINTVKAMLLEFGLAVALCGAVILAAGGPNDKTMRVGLVLAGLFITITEAYRQFPELGPVVRRALFGPELSSHEQHISDMVSQTASHVLGVLSEQISDVGSELHDLHIRISEMDRRFRELEYNLNHLRADVERLARKSPGGSEQPVDPVSFAGQIFMRGFEQDKQLEEFRLREHRAPDTAKSFWSLALLRHDRDTAMSLYLRPEVVALVRSVDAAPAVFERFMAAILEELNLKR